MEKDWKHTLTPMPEGARGALRPPDGEMGDISDPVVFARERFGFEAAETQKLILRGRGRGIVNCTRQYGKSMVTAIKAVHRAYTEPGSLVLAMSPTARQAGEYLKKAKDFTRKLGIDPRGDGHNRMSIQFPNGSRIVALPGKGETTRGYTAVSLLLVDEAAYVKDDAYGAIRPVLAVSGGDLWIMSTPLGKRGFFHRTWTAGGPGWQKILVTAPECPWIKEEILAREKEDLGERFFRQDYLCEFLDVEDGLFEEYLLKRASRHDFGDV